MGKDATEPRGDLIIRTMARPTDANPSGSVFGGWILAQMDLAGGLRAWWRAKGRTATVAVSSIEFHRPVAVGDVVSVYADIVRVGTTSIAIHVEAWKLARLAKPPGVKVTEGEFTFVALDEDGSKRPVPPDDD